jgi:hypothetical protein
MNQIFVFFLSFSFSSSSSFFFNGFSLYNSGCPGTCSVDQVRSQTLNSDLPVSASQVLGLKVCATTVQLNLLLSYVESFLCHELFLSGGRVRGEGMVFN